MSELFDIFTGYIKCEKCGKKHYVNFRTKEFGCLFKEYKWGEKTTICKDKVINFTYICTETNEKLKAYCIVKKGIIIGFFNEIDYDFIKDKKINISFIKENSIITTYLDQCDVNYGFEINQNRIIDRNKKIGDTINMFNKEWTIIEILKEELIKEDSIEYNIAKERYEDNLVYLVEKNNEMRLIRVTNSYKYMANCKLREKYIEEDKNDYMAQNLCKLVKITEK